MHPFLVVATALRAVTHSSNHAGRCGGNHSSKSGLSDGYFNWLWQPEAW
ncbi:MAG: hypothetical protein ABIQ70_10360 [Dokdonella sp.]